MISLYGNDGIEGDLSMMSGTMSNVISCKICGLSLQIAEMDDVMKSDGKLVKMNEETIDGKAGTDPILIGKSGYDYNSLIKSKIFDKESLSIYELLVVKIIDKLNLLFKPDTVLEMLNLIKVQINQTTHPSENAKTLLRMTMTGAYLLIYLQMNSELLINMNNHYKILFTGIFGTIKLDPKSDEVKIYGSELIDNGFNFITNLLLKIGISGFKEKDNNKRIAIIYKNIKNAYTHLIDANPSYAIKISKTQIKSKNQPKNIKSIVLSDKTKKECNSSIELLNSTLEDRINLDKMWGIPNILIKTTEEKSNYANAYSLIDGTTKICSMYTTSLYKDESMLFEKVPIQIVGTIENEMNFKINNFQNLRKRIRNERRTFVNSSLNIVPANEKRLMETIQTGVIDIYRQFDSLLITSNDNPEDIFSVYCHKFLDDERNIYPTVGTKHSFTHFNRIFSYVNCVELGGEYLNSKCIHCGESVINIKQKLEDKFYDNLYRDAKSNLLRYNAQFPNTAQESITYDTSNIINQKLDNTTLENEIEFLLSTMNRIFIGTDTIERINKLNVNNIKQMFNLDKWQEEKNIDFINQFGTKSKLGGYDYEPIQNQLISMKTANVPETIINEQIGELVKILEDKKESYSRSMYNGINGDIISQVIKHLKELLKEITMFSNDKYTNITDETQIFKNKRNLFKNMKNKLIYNNDILSRKCLVCRFN